MILVAHILIALAGLIYSTYLYFNPTPSKFRPANYLLAATIGSGTYLVISTGAPLLKTCLSGLLYLGVVYALITAARHRLAKEHQRIK